MTDADHYRTLDAALRAVDAEKSAAEAHGMLCGMLSTPGETRQAAWIAEVLANTRPKGQAAQECLVALTSVFEATETDMADSELRFSPLLPADAAALADRARALGDWCEGFLFGLGLGGLTDRGTLPREAAEVVSDFGEIARVDAEAELGDGGEDAYAELVEYVRMGALLVREHLAGSAPQPAETAGKPDGSRRLH